MHEIDAIVYDTPKRKIEPSVRFRPPLSRPWGREGEVVPAQHRDAEHDEADPDRDRRPFHVVDERRDTGVDERADDPEDDEEAGRHGGAHEQRRADTRPRSSSAPFAASMPRKYDRYAGSIANPHGFTVATAPAVNA